MKVNPHITSQAQMSRGSCSVWRTIYARKPTKPAEITQKTPKTDLIKAAIVRFYSFAGVLSMPGTIGVMYDSLCNF